MKGALITSALAMAAAGALPATSASAGDGGGCGQGLTRSQIGSPALANRSTLSDAQWAALLTAADANQNTYLCWHEVGKVGSSGNNELNIHDDNANAG